jgi:hypothetical protein
MDAIEGAILALIATSKEFQIKLFGMGASLVVIGFLLGLLAAFVFITEPLTEMYKTQYEKLTKNETLKCYDTTNMTSPFLVDRLKLRDYCTATYCSEFPVIGFDKCK